MFVCFVFEIFVNLNYIKTNGRISMKFHTLELGLTRETLPSKMIWLNNKHQLLLSFFLLCGLETLVINKNTVTLNKVRDIKQ